MKSSREIHYRRAVNNKNAHYADIGARGRYSRLFRSRARLNASFSEKTSKKKTRAINGGMNNAIRFF